jgi:hypothetical protein
MAKRESQGLQIALIVFVMITVLFMVTTVLFWKKFDTARAEASDLQNRLSRAETDRRAAQDEMGNIKEKLLGYPRETAYTEIENEFNKVMLAYAQSLPEDQRNYKNLPDQLIKALADQSGRLTKASSTEMDLKRQRDEVGKRESERASQALKEKEAAEGTLAQEKSQYDRDRQRIEQAQTQELNSYRTNLATREEEIKKKTDEIGLKDKEVRDLTLNNEKLRDQVKGYLTESLDVPDGRIIYVNQRLRRVYIDLGLSDAVRPQMTFDVYDADAASLAQPRVKGKIEVVRVVDDHSCEATIRTDELKNPILAGDVIHSHIWQPGSRQRFALAGKIDVDEDGRSDLDLVKSLIEINGGIIDAVVDDEGKLTGQVTIQTRYLALGPAPTEDEPLRAYTAIIKEADTQGVQKISLDQILNYVGYDGKQRTVALGKSARAIDFKATPGDGVVRTSQGSVSALYDADNPPVRAPEEK